MRWSVLGGVLCVLVGTSQRLGAQSVDPVWEPSASYSWKANDRWGFNGKMTGFVALDRLNEQAALEHVEGQVAAGYSRSVRLKLGATYLYRAVEPLEGIPSDEHRLGQQAGFVTYLGDRRLAHRLRLEQRIRPGRYANRWRYRLGYEVPLQGERLDPGERYAVGTAEALATFTRSAGAGAVRLGAALGWFRGGGHAWEMGAELRVGSLFDGGAMSRQLLVTTSYFFSR